jgi:colanic acid/amylovoran biosynthesis glycosyltransferase
MDSEQRKVIVWSGFMLNPSETFIRNQAIAMRRFVPHFAGVRYSNDSLLSRDECTLVNDGGRAGAMREVMFKVAGVPPCFRRRLERLQPALIHAHHGVNGALALPLARALRVPLVVTFHGADATVNKPPDHYSLAHRAFCRRVEQLKRDVALFTADSAFIKRKLVERGYPADQIVVHHVGVDTQTFKADPAVAREPVVLFVGRLAEKKGVEYLIRAMEPVQATAPHLKLVIIGDGPLRAQLHSLAAEKLKNYEFLGLQPSSVVKQWMNRAAVLAVPSVTASNGDCEGLPTVIQEGMAMGIPVVATRHAGNCEAITEGETGLTTAERDVEMLADHIARLCSNPTLWKKISANARRAVEAHLDINKQTARLEAHYERIVAPRSSPAPEGRKNVAHGASRGVDDRCAAHSPVGA